MFTLGGSSSDDSSSGRTKIQRPPTEKKQTSSSKVVAARTINEELFEDDNVFESDDEDDEIDESAIDDDDWEDTNEESGQAVFDEIWFQKVDSRQRLTSHKSLLTIQLATSQSTSAFDQSNMLPAVGPSVASSLDSEDNSPLAMNGKAIPIAPRQIDSQSVQARSPRTNRRNMLATELTVSLRQHLLWGHQQKSRTANTVLKRRHTAQDVANLKQDPEKVCMEENSGALYTHWNDLFDAGTSEYHSNGW